MSTPPNLAWDETPAALELLAKVDAFERSSDRCAGLGWHEPAKAFAEMAKDALLDLDDLRGEALNAIADTRAPRNSPAWFDAWEAADEQAVNVSDAVQRARKLRFGDGLLEEAA